MSFDRMSTLEKIVHLTKNLEDEMGDEGWVNLNQVDEIPNFVREEDHDDEIQEREDRIEELESENEGLKSQFEELDEENEELKKENDELKKRQACIYRSAGEHQRSLDEENEELKKENDELKKNPLVLIPKVKMDLIGEIEKLKKEINQKTETITEMSRLIREVLVLNKEDDHPVVEFIVE